MRPIILVIAGTLLAACGTSPKQKWKNVHPGQRGTDVIRLMGYPDGYQKIDGGTLVIWQMDRWEKCAVAIDRTGEVREKGCKDDAQARARTRAAALNYLGQTQKVQQAPQRLQFYELKTRSSDTVNCTSQTYGQTKYTNCQGF